MKTRTETKRSNYIEKREIEREILFCQYQIYWCVLLLTEFRVVFPSHFANSLYCVNVGLFLFYFSLFSSFSIVVVFDVVLVVFVFVAIVIETDIHFDRIFFFSCMMCRLCVYMCKCLLDILSIISSITFCGWFVRANGCNIQVVTSESWRQQRRQQRLWIRWAGQMCKTQPMNIEQRWLSTLQFRHYKNAFDFDLELEFIRGRKRIIVQYPTQIHAHTTEHSHVPTWKRQIK